MIDWVIEGPRIKANAAAHGVDWAFVAAIREAENGPVGTEFGVETNGVVGYDAQLEACTATIAHRLEAYPSNPLIRCFSADGFSRIRYTPTFIAYFASVWAPIGADNDPQSLNKNWYKNASAAYQRLVDRDLVS